MGGGQDINKKNLKNLLDVVGIECDDEKVTLVVEQKVNQLKNFSPRDQRSWHQCPLEVHLLAELLLQPLVVLPLLKPQKKKRKKSLKKNPMMTWDLVSSIKMSAFKIHVLM